MRRALLALTIPELFRLWSDTWRFRFENPEVRDALREMIRRMKEERRAAYIYVNNRLEGNAPETIQAVVAD